jgi:hypothetical protein
LNFKKTPFFRRKLAENRRKLAKIAENSDHNKFFSRAFQNASICYDFRLQDDDKHFLQLLFNATSFGLFRLTRQQGWFAQIQVTIQQTHGPW